MISAAEASSDVHGAQLLRALKGLLSAGEALEAFGAGGSQLRAEGLEAGVDARDLLAMGSVEVLGRLPKIRKALVQLESMARERRPEIAVLIDYPEFHLRLAARLKKLGIPVVCFIPPKLWVWRKGRIRKLRDLFAKVLCILPFEEAFYAREGMPVSYVGNPLIDELPWSLTREAARRELGWSESDVGVALLPGSRPAELERHFEVMLQATASLVPELRTRGKLSPGAQLKVVIPLAETTDLARWQGRLAERRWSSGLPREWSDGLRVVLSQGGAHRALRAADAGMVKSGTSTLEAGLLGLPHVVMYRPSAVTAFLFQHLVRYRDPVALVNLMQRDSAGRPIQVLPELLCEQATPGALAQAMGPMLWDEAYRNSLVRQLSEVRRVVFGGGDLPISPSLRAAEEVRSVWSAGR